MVKEIELRITDIDVKQAKRRLREAGARHIAYKKLTRFEIRLVNTPKLKRWLRVRTDGKKTTFTMKENRGLKENVHEFETEVEDFRTMGRILLAAFPGNLKAFIESTRDIYALDGTEITIDKWPEIPHFMEIEGKSRAQVNAVYRKLKIAGKPVGNIWDIYRLYGLSFAKVNVKSDSAVRKLLG